MIRSLRDYYPLLVIGAVMLWSAWSVASFRLEQSPPGTITIQLSHYQLEAGVRDGFDILIKDYEKLHPNVRVIQDSVPEAGYGQWATTQLVGGTAPDIIELHGGVMNSAILAVYATRYFKNLTETVNQPNPYNRGTELESVSLRNTYKDGMKTSYIDEAQRYVAVPLSVQGTKIFYNKTLLKKLTGLDEPPGEYRAFLTVCEKIKAQTDAAGQHYAPIACSKFHINQWLTIMFHPLTFRNLFKADFNGDLGLGADEFFAAYRSHRLSMHDETFEKCYRMIGEVRQYFPSGWAGLQRDEAVFRFAQQRSVFMSATTQEAFSLYDLSQGKFDVDIADFPLISKEDPVYGSLAEGPRWEKPDDTFRFVVTRYSKHPEIALDFLLFLSGKKQNEKLNDIAHWVPCIVGAKTPDFLKKFDPHLVGILGAFQVNVGVDTMIRWNQLSSLYNNNNISYAKMATEFEHYLSTQSERQYWDRQREQRRDLSREETVAASLRIQAIDAGDGANDGLWLRYAGFERSRLMDLGINLGKVNHIFAEKPRPGAVGPYEYSPEALEKVRARVQAAAIPTP